MLRNIPKVLAIFAVGTVGGIFADQILWPYFIERPLFYKYRLEQSPVYVTDEITIQENIALQDAISKTEKAVVGIQSTTKSGKILEGAGMIITSDGLAVTLAELVPQGSNSSFFVEGKSVTFQVLKRDLNQNLALIKIEKNNLLTTGLADFGKTKQGQRIFLIGIIFKNGIAQTAVNEGIIRAFDENIIETNISEKTQMQGSPLFDIEGNFLGLSTINKEGKVSATPVSKIKEFAGF